MTMLYDSHCHLDAAEFDVDRNAVLARARAAGVTRQLVPAVNRAGWPKLRGICTEEEGLRPAYGLHPMFLADHRDADLDALRRWLDGERPAAVGECGLDFYVEGLDHDAMARFFDGQLRLAREFDLPVVVHARRAVDAVIQAIRKIGGLHGVVHSWSGSDEQARQLWDLGFSLGIGGPVTYERARRLRRTVASMPGEFLLLETDAPDQPGQAQRGGRNEPAFLVEVLETVAALRGQSADEVARQTFTNAERLFGRGA
ncbi:TatD family hydrolase [Arenimonas composti]|nr:TatD family hydrolase [Arenimonas composti]